MMTASRTKIPDKAFRRRSKRAVAGYTTALWARIIRQLIRMGRGEGWRGTATELADTLDRSVINNGRFMNASALSRQLRAIAPYLRDDDLDVTFDKGEVRIVSRE